jgi:hypothetical protein
MRKRDDWMIRCSRCKQERKEYGRTGFCHCCYNYHRIHGNSGKPYRGPGHPCQVIVCPVCIQSFKREKLQTKYCSRACYSQRMRQPIICARCHRVRRQKCKGMCAPCYVYLNYRQHHPRLKLWERKKTGPKGPHTPKVAA